MAARIRKGDEVIVISGGSKGIIGTVQEVMVKSSRAIVSNTLSGIKHIKGDNRGKNRGQPGRFEEFIKSIHISNLAHVVDGKPTRVYFKIEKDKKFLYAKGSNKEIRSV